MLATVIGRPLHKHQFTQTHAQIDWREKDINYIRLLWLNFNSSISHVSQLQRDSWSYLFQNMFVIMFDCSAANIIRIGNDELALRFDNYYGSIKCSIKINPHTCNAVNNGKYKSGSSYFPVGMAPSTLGIICRPSNAAMKYVYKTKVTTCCIYQANTRQRCKSKMVKIIEKIVWNLDTCY